VACIRLFRTESFRLAAWFAVIFLAVTGALIGTAYWIVEDAQTTALLSAIDNDILAINNGYRDAGQFEAIELVQQLMPRSPLSRASSDSYLFLYDARQGQLAGNVSGIPLRTGVFSIEVTLPNVASATHRDRLKLIGKGSTLPNSEYLFAGRDTQPIAATRARIVTAFAWIAGVAIVLAAMGGVALSVQFMRRIDEFARTCETIVAGRFNDRLAVRGKGDELDRLATAVNRMLDRISALVDNLRQVSSDIAHDLRTPLTHLRQRLETARLKSTSMEDYSIAVSRAVEDTDQLLAIFSALLRISQIEAGTRAASFKNIVLSDLLEDLCEMYQPVAEDRHQTLTSDIARHVAVYGDAELLKQLCVNVVENAIRHTPPGTIIHIALRSEGNCAKILIKDNGPGIPEAEHPHVFKRFYRLMRNRSTPGNGLGLALAAAIVELHDATIELADAQPGLQVCISMPRLS